ncbi:MAG: DUF2807 domain-containing protein [Bacteroidales bacterium]|nr:DUF2807 domain-containing protein [Bacteroidales bacterium]
MKKSILIIAILLSISVIYSQECITASGGIVTEEYNLDAFTSVDIRFVGDVIIHQGPHHKTKVTANENVIQHVRFQVENGKLSVYADKNFNNVKKLVVEIYTPTLEVLSMRGPGDVTVEKRNEPQLTVINMGVGECTLQCLKIEGSLELHNKGAGDIKVSSPDPIRQQTLLINNSGAGGVYILGSHVSNSLIVNNMGAGDVSVNLMSIPTDELILQNKSVGDIIIQNVLAKRLELRILSTGNLKMMNGKAEEMTLESVGVGNVHLLLKVANAHITHGGVGNIIATVTGTAYLTEKSELGKVTIHGGGKIVKEKP